MIEGRMNGVAEAHHGQSMFRFGFPMNVNDAYANFVKDQQHYGRQLPHELKVTNAGYHGPYVGAEHPAPMNLVQKTMPENGYAFSHRNVGAPPFANMFGYPAPPFIPGAGPYTPHHQQVHFTPHKSYTAAPATSMDISISRPGPESSPIDVKPPTASVNGENHTFKIPDEGNSRYYQKNKPRKRQVHVPTPAPIPVPITTTAPSAPPIIEQTPQPQVIPQSQLQSPLRPTYNENIKLPKLDNFGAGHVAYFGHDPKLKNTKNVTKEQYRSLLERGELIPIEEVTVEDWRRVVDTEHLDLNLITVKKISELHESDKVMLSFWYGNQLELGVLEVEAERPFFVFGRGWKSYLPDRTREKLKGMNCGKINEGDVVLVLTERNHNILTPKNENRKRKKEDVPTEQHPKNRRIHKFTDLNESRSNDSYHEFTNSNSNCNNVSMSAAAANRHTVKKPGMENDSNNNNETIAKRKRSAEEAKARRWSDSCLEKTC